MKCQEFKAHKRITKYKRSIKVPTQLATNDRVLEEQERTRRINEERSLSFIEITRRAVVRTRLQYEFLIARYMWKSMGVFSGKQVRLMKVKQMEEMERTRRIVDDSRLNQNEKLRRCQLLTELHEELKQKQNSLPGEAVPFLIRGAPLHSAVRGRTRSQVPQKLKAELRTTEQPEATRGRTQLQEDELVLQSERSMSELNLNFTKAVEEQERHRRVAEELLLDELAKQRSIHSRLYSRWLEEEEKNRRIMVSQRPI